MRIPFAVWTTVLAVLIFASMTAWNYVSFGTLDPDWSMVFLIGGIWVGVMVLNVIIEWFRRESRSKPSDMSDDFASKFGED